MIPRRALPLLASGLSICLLPMNTIAANLNVPTQFATVQQAIDAATSGDVILLAPGTYPERLTVNQIALTIRSTTGNPSDVRIGTPGSNTIITAVGTPNLVIDGITLSGGIGSRGPICGSLGLTIFAGAILSTNSNLTISRCVLSDNTADLGGVIFMSGGNLQVRNSTFTGNGRTPAPTGSSSVGAILRSCDREAPVTVLVEDSVFTDNGDLSEALALIAPFNGTLTVRRSQFIGNRGAIIEPTGLTDLTVEDCSFIDNASIRGCINSALSAEGAAISISSSTFRGNEGSNAADISALMPAGESTLTVRNTSFSNSIGIPIVYTQQLGGSAFIDRCTIRGGQGAGIAIFASGGTTIVANSLIAGVDGDGIILSNASEPATTNVVNSTIVGSGNEGIRLDALLVGTLNVRNSIVWGNAARQIGSPLVPIPISASTINASYSAVQGGYSGIGNLSQPPQFVAGVGATGNYKLLPTSPYIDAGDNSVVFSPSGLDLAGGTRNVDAPGTSDTGAGTSPVVDIGAYEFAPATCRADFDQSGEVNITDIFAFLGGWFAGNPRADIDGVDGVALPDIFAFLLAWFAGC